MSFCYSASPKLCRVGKSLMCKGIQANPATWATSPARGTDSTLIENLDGA
jgi:hypothetical protein